MAVGLVTLTVGSLFSGIGGLDLGLERAGMTVRWQSEIDPYCCRVLAKHWPDVPNLGDVTTVDWSTVEPVDLVCGGYPCQPFSLAGRRSGADDPRHLWPHFRDAIRHLRPRYALLENVPGHLTLGFADVLADLAELGFDAEWSIVSAADVGAPHLRRRLFVVAYANGEGKPRRRIELSSCSASSWHVADTDGAGLQDRWRPRSPRRTVSRCGDVGNTDGSSSNAYASPGGSWCAAGESGWWRPQSGVGIRPDGLPTGLDGGRLDAETAQTGPSEALHGMWHVDGEEDDQRQARGPNRVPETSLLRPGLHGDGLCQRHRAAELEASQGVKVPWDLLRVVWGYDQTARPSHRRECEQRLAVEHPDLVRLLSRHAPPPCPTCWVDGSWESGLSRTATEVPNRPDRLRALGNAVVPQVAELIGRRVMEMAA
jgi:site-specific DNA-cytosine methylase